MIRYITFPFYKNEQPANSFPLCGMTLRAAGSMRFRWNEKNTNRDITLLQIKDELSVSEKIVVPVQLNHTHVVYDVIKDVDTKNLIGDGIITKNRELIPTVTVADCVPIYLYDDKTGVFGIVHSGWKGTGIIAEAINLAAKNYNSKAEDFCVVIGPHIRDCCYIVNKERADFFAINFTPECIMPLEKGIQVDWNIGEGTLYRLSLVKANLACLKKIGVKRENIFVHPDCTCCNEQYGSNRRETKKSGQPDCFTVQAAFIANL